MSTGVGGTNGAPSGRTVETELDRDIRASRRVLVFPGNGAGEWYPPRYHWWSRRATGEGFEMRDDAGWMDEALAEARRAGELGEVPVGAVVVRGGEIVGRGHNRREVDADPLAHAEVLAIREAARAVGGWRLDGATLYVTLEPCAMCAGALVLSRVDRLVFATRDPKAGFCGSLGNLVADPRLNHRVEVSEGVRGEEAARLLRGFFARLRERAAL